MEALVRCPRCWKRVPETSRFCRRCGQALSAPPPLPPPGQQGSSPAAGSGIAALLSFILMGAVSVIGIALFSASMHPTPPAPPPVIIEGDPPDATGPSIPAPSHHDGRRHEFPDRYRHSWDRSSTRYWRERQPDDSDAPPSPNWYPTRSDRQ